MATHKMKKQIQITMFDGTGDFGIWKKRMLANLSVQGLKDVLSLQSQALVMTKTDDEDEDSRRREILKKLQDPKEMRRR